MLTSVKKRFGVELLTCSALKEHNSKSQPASCCGRPPSSPAQLSKLVLGFRMYRLILSCAVPYHWYSSAQCRGKYSPKIVPRSACRQQTEAGLFGSCRKEAGLLTCRTPTQLSWEKLPNPPTSAASPALLQTHTAGRKAGIQDSAGLAKGCLAMPALTHHCHVLPKALSCLGESC